MQSKSIRQWDLWLNTSEGLTARNSLEGRTGMKKMEAFNLKEKAKRQGFCRKNSKARKENKRDV